MWKCTNCHHLELAAEKPEHCPVLGVKCLATQAAIKKALGPIQKAAKEAKAKLGKLKPEQEIMVGAVREIEVQIETLAAQIAEAKRLSAEHEKDIKRLEDLMASINSCQQRIDENENAEAVDVGALDRRIHLNETLLERVRAYAANKTDWDAEQARAARTREDHVTWDAIAQALKPNGIEADLLGLLMPEFLSLANEIAVETGVGQVLLTDDLEIQVLRPSGRTMLAPQLSRSARLRLGYGIQHAIARLVGFPMLIVDELDVFNPKVLPGVLTTLLKVAKGYPAGILGFATLKVDQPVRPQSDEVAMYWLSGQGLREVA